MTEADLDRVEESLNRRLPADYREFVLTCPKDDWIRYCNYLYGSCFELVQRNQRIDRPWPDFQVSEPDGAGGYTPERPWPAEWTAIGDGDSEWYTFVRSDAPGVWEWPHDTRQVRKVAETFAEYLADLKDKIGPPPVLTVTEHPTLGRLTWNPECKQWTAEVSGAWMIFNPSVGEVEPFPAHYAEVAMAAMTAEQRVFADAMAAGGWSEFLEMNRGDAKGMTADTVRSKLHGPTLNIFPGPTIHFVYSAEDLDLLLFSVETDGQLVVQDQQWHR